MMKYLCVLLFLFLMPNTLLANGQTTVVEVDGFGLSQSEAIQNALIEAIRQTKGVSIDSQKAFAKQIRSESVSNNGDNSRQIEVSSKSQSVVKEATKGLIQEYRIVNSKKNGPNDWVVKLAVMMMRYETPGLSPKNRRKLAVMPFHVESPSFSFSEIIVRSDEASRHLSQALVTEFSQSRRFAVLDRDFMGEFLSEKQLLTSGDVPIQEQVKLGNVLGVDYMVVGTIKGAGFEEHVRELQLTGQTQYGWYAHASVDYRIILMATRQVKWSNSVSVEMSSLNSPELGTIVDPAQVRDAVFLKAAKQIAEESLDNIYPIQVVSAQGGGGYVLNQGGSGLEPGLMLDVFGRGKPITDPYTKESLGYTEEWVALLEVTRVTPKMSYARLVEGEPAQLKDGSICRRRATGMSGAAEMPPTTPNATGIIKGVKLPFD